MPDPTRAREVARARRRRPALLLYAPWFAAMGACLVLSTLGYARVSGISERTTRAISRSIAVACAGMSVGWLRAVSLHWNLNTDLLF